MRQVLSHASLALGKCFCGKNRYVKEIKIDQLTISHKDSALFWWEEWTTTVKIPYVSKGLHVQIQSFLFIRGAVDLS